MELIRYVGERIREMRNRHGGGAWNLSRCLGQSPEYRRLTLSLAGKPGRIVQALRTWTR